MERKAARSASSSAAPSGLARQPARQLLDALDLLEVGAELLLVDDAAEARDAAAQRDLEVLLPEEARVGEAGAQHPLVAGADLPHVGGLHVARS